MNFDLNSVFKKDWSRWLLILAGVCVSSLHIKQFYYSHDTLKWFTFDVLLSLFVIINWPKKMLFKLTPLFILIMAIAAYMVLSLIWAPNKMMGVEFVYRFLLVATTGYVLLENINKYHLLPLLLDIVVISAFVFCVQFIVERHILELPYNVGSYSPIGFMNNSGQVFNIWIPALVLFTFLNRNNYFKVTLAVGLLLCVVSILMEAATRGTIIGLALGELVVFSIMLVQNRKRALYFLSITLLLSSGLIIYQTFDALKNGKLSSKIAAFEQGISASTGRRIDMFQNTAEMALDNPLGVGVNNFEYIHPKYAKPGTEKASPHVNEHTILRTPHNIILKMYSELGWVGGTLFLLLLGWIFCCSVYNAIKGSLVDKWLLVAVTAVLFHSMVSAVFLTPASLFFSFILFTLVISRTQVLRELRPVETIKIPRAVRFSWVLVPVLSCAVMVSEFYAYHGRIQFDGALLNRAIQLNPYNDRAWYTLSHVKYRRERNLRESLGAIDHFLQINPYHLAGLYIQSERRFQVGDKRQAMESVELLLGIYPSYKKAQRLRNTIQRSIIAQ